MFQKIQSALWELIVVGILIMSRAQLIGAIVSH
jgi:hypothetical protein